MTLDKLPVGHWALVAGVEAPRHASEWRTHLQDLGFQPGETVAVLRRAALGGDPMVVRVSGGTYALRRAEAACVRLLHPDAGEAPAR